MILDNEQKNQLKVHEWIVKYNEEGNLDIVTGYFTIGALAYLAKHTEDKIDRYRFVLGDIVNFDDRLRALDLLNENLNIEITIRLKRYAKEAIDFLKLNKVEAKTLEPNFCHAKLYLKTAKNDDRNNYFVSGSSNLTEAGMGLKTTSNLELNIGETSNNHQYKELVEWFNKVLWESPQAHTKKTILDENGVKTTKDFKEYLIEEIAKLFKDYMPEHIYFKILFELFGAGKTSEEDEKQILKLEETQVYKKLYDFQKGGVKSLIQMLNSYNGAILADAVGLGKTWSALAVMKSYEMKGHEVVLLCPKKLEQNWTQYLKRQNSIFEEDKFDYVVRFHTDLREGGLHSNNLNEDYFTNAKPKLFVIDESHNLRNDKSRRYQFLVDEILKKSKGSIKVLLLSATPINNSFKDIRNQFKLMSKGDNDGFAESLDVANIEHTFREVQTEFNKWSNEPNAKLADFHKTIKESAFFRLTDHLLVARTRKSVKTNFDNTLSFPTHKKPINIFETPLKFGDVENFAELMENLDLNLSAYLPATYLLTEEERLARNKKRKGIDDEAQREHFLVKMMMILMLKRLESSWYSFNITVQRIYNHHENALNKINQYQLHKQNLADADIDIMEDVADIVSEQDELEMQLLDGISFGKKAPISLKEIDKQGNLEEFKTAIKKDKKSLQYILANVKNFETAFNNETELNSVDGKLQKLLQIIVEKQQTNNKKIVIFSAYKDTTSYLFEQLTRRGFSQFAMVTGDENKVHNEPISHKKHEPILERFAPYTKLFKEKNWNQYDIENLSYADWQQHITTDHPKTLEKLQNPIDILIATDVLSEGQNLQDADMVINYDIHWNPVRVIQRVGRIDRIGSPNTDIQTVNFWPAKDIDDYINLKARVEKRMAIMKFTGSEVINEFTDEFNDLAESQKLEDQQNANMIRQMETSMQELDGEKSIGFDDFSFDNYRQQLRAMLKQKEKEFQYMPKGVFSGFKIKKEPEMKKGIMALLGYPAQKIYNPNFNYLSHELIYIDEQGNQISNNQKHILELLSKHYKEPRFVSSAIDSGNETEIKKLTNALNTWINNQVKSEIEHPDGSKKTVIGNAALDILNAMKKSPKTAIQKLAQEGNASQKFQLDNFDLITWLILDDE